MCGFETNKSSIIGQQNQSHLRGLNLKKNQVYPFPLLSVNSAGLIYNNPIPIPISLQQNYDIDIEEYWGHLD
jgi:hypothetical protein